MACITNGRIPPGALRLFIVFNSEMFAVSKTHVIPLDTPINIQSGSLLQMYLDIKIIQGL